MTNILFIVDRNYLALLWHAWWFNNMCFHKFTIYISNS